MDKRKSVKIKMLLACVIILICAVITVKVLAAEHEGRELSTTKWQYLALTHELVRDVSSDGLGTRITKLGQDGWELVSVENFSESGTTTKTVFYFKRRL